MSLLTVLEILAFLSLSVWLVLFLLWGGFWHIWESDSDRHRSPEPGEWPPVTAIVPARNEAASIAPVVTALGTQDYPGQFSVIIVDDHSQDGTAELARNAASGSGPARAIDILSAPPRRGHVQQKQGLL